MKQDKIDSSCFIISVLIYISNHVTFIVTKRKSPSNTSELLIRVLSTVNVKEKKNDQEENSNEIQEPFCI
jgi:hypothetical protein